MVNTATQAYDFIKAAVMSGEYKAGTRLKEGQIADLVGVSRTPVREALRRLSAEGFLTMPPNQGARVIKWSAEDLREIINLRSVLESFGTSVAAGKINSEKLEFLESLAIAMELAVANGNEKDLESITKLNSQFHMTIINASGNTRLAEFIASLAHPLLIQRQFSSYNNYQLQRSMMHHREIIDALQARDAGWASAIMQSHILASGRADHHSS